MAKAKVVQTPILATVSSVEPHRFDDASALVTVALSSGEASQGALTYQFPMPAQTLADGTEVPASDPFAVPGEPSSAEVAAGCMVLARYWAAQQGWPSAESDIALTVEGP